MTPVPVLVDYDNIDAIHRSQGPVSLARMLLALLPPNLLHPYDSVSIRLYGGWRSATGLTPYAQELAASIARDAPTTFNVTHIGNQKKLRVLVSLANGPAGTRKVFPETLARNRPLRHFRARTAPWHECTSGNACGMTLLHNAHNATPCRTANCHVRIGDILVRDEQKMVDTLMVADIAHETFVSRAEDIIVVSSDVDVWPGIFLALHNGRRVTQMHTQTGWATSRQLMDTLDDAMAAGYRQFSV